MILPDLQKRAPEPISIPLLLKECQRGVRKSQEKLYRQYYSYGLTVCLHYSKNREEAEEILNDGFVKVFKRLHQYSGNHSFKPWLRKILVHSAIDYFRKYHRHEKGSKIIPLYQQTSVQNEAIGKLSMDDALLLLQKLPPAYRIVFNLFVLEGYSHAEIAEQLNIKVGTSKSNLAKAKKKMASIVKKQNIVLV